MPRQFVQEQAVYCRKAILAIVIVVDVAASNLLAADSAPAPDAVKAAITRSIALLERGTAGSVEQRKCFTCHNQAVPVLALVEARKRGFAIDKGNLDRQIQHTVAYLARGRKDYLEGRGQGGKVVTAGYALWTLEAAGWNSDDTTSAVTDFLLQYQQQESHWKHPGKRPPSSGSDFTTTYVALRGLAAFGTKTQKPKIEARAATVSKWLLNETPADTEDRVFRLRALPLVGGNEQEVRSAVKDLIDSQRADGGWAQMAKMDSDAYATGTVLVALLAADGHSEDAPAIGRGVQYLIDTQLPDGTWRVASRAEPFQTYYESGFPHGTDQFISITATSWSTLALLLALPDSP